MMILCPSAFRTTTVAESFPDWYYVLDCRTISRLIIRTYFRGTADNLQTEIGSLAYPFDRDNTT